MNRNAAPEVSSGGARVVASGTVIPFRDPGEVAFELGPPEERLAVIVRFEDGAAGGSEPRVDVERASARLVRVVVRGGGAGTSAPLTLGTLSGLKLWAHFLGSGSGTGPKTLHYTFFVEGGDIGLAETLLRD
jgi:hypothetical protein